MSSSTKTDTLDLIRMAHFLEVLGFVGALYLLSLASKAWSLRSRTKQAALQHGCQPPNRYPNLDPFLGFDLARLLRKENKLGRQQRVFPNLHREYGDTFSFKALSSRRISTCNPKNIQTILATNSDDWGVEPIRGNFAEPFLGKGVFMHDGQTWKRARALIRPTFNRTEIADLENFEIHVGRLLALIPRDGSTVDLQPLFKTLVSACWDECVMVTWLTRSISISSSIRLLNFSSASLLSLFFLILHLIQSSLPKHLTPLCRDLAKDCKCSCSKTRFS